MFGKAFKIMSPATTKGVSQNNARKKPKTKQTYCAASYENSTNST